MIQLKPIGIVRSTLTEAQRDRHWDDNESKIVIEDEWRDVLDGIPVLDPKPYLERNDAITNTRVGAWIEKWWTTSRAKQVFGANA